MCITCSTTHHLGKVVVDLECFVLQLLLLLSCGLDCLVQMSHLRLEREKGSGDRNDSFGSEILFVCTCDMYYLQLPILLDVLPALQKGEIIVCANQSWKGIVVCSGSEMQQYKCEWFSKSNATAAHVALFPRGLGTKLQHMVFWLQHLN